MIPMTRHPEGYVMSESVSKEVSHWGKGLDVFCVADEEKHGQHGPPSSIGLIGFVSRFEFFNIYLKIYETMMNNIHLSTLSKKLKCFSKIINKTLELLQMICQGFRCVPNHPFPHSLTDKCHVIHWDPVVCHASIGLSWICPSVGRSVCLNFRKGRAVTLPCSYLRTFPFIDSQKLVLDDTAVVVLPDLNTTGKKELSLLVINLNGHL